MRYGERGLKMPIYYDFENLNKATAKLDEFIYDTELETEDEKTLIELYDNISFEIYKLEELLSDHNGQVEARE